MDGDTNYPDSALQCPQPGPSLTTLTTTRPAVFMDGVGRHQSSFHSYATFFEQAKNGTLPHLSFIHPNDTWTDVSEIDIALDLCKWCLLTCKCIATFSILAMTWRKENDSPKTSTRRSGPELAGIKLSSLCSTTTRAGSVKQ